MALRDSTRSGISNREWHTHKRINTSESDTVSSGNFESAEQAVRFQDAQDMYHQGQLARRRGAAIITEMALSISRHRMAGLTLAEGYGKTRRLLTAKEESILLWGCDTLQCSG